MFSQLGSIYKTIFRKTENVDTRLEIHREEKDRGKKRDSDENKNDSNSDFWEDSTIISIDAIREFLKNYLDPDVRQNQNLTSQTFKSPALLNQTNKIAMSAYARTLSLDHAEEENKNSNEILPTKDMSLSDEEDKVFELLNDLILLEQNNIHFLTLEKSNDFLDSIFLSVDTLKSNL